MARRIYNTIDIKIVCDDEYQDIFFEKEGLK